MKFLFDENLSPRLVVLLADVFPNSLHVRDVGLKSAEDSLVWNYARNHDLVIVSKDADMHQRCFVFAHRRKLSGYVWVTAPLQTLPICFAGISKRLKFSKRMNLPHFKSLVETSGRLVFVSINNPVLHHEHHLLHSLNILQRIAGHGDNVGPFAGC